MFLDRLAKIHMSSTRMFGAMLINIIEWIHEDFGLQVRLIGRQSGLVCYLRDSNCLKFLEGHWIH